MEVPAVSKSLRALDYLSWPTESAAPAGSDLREGYNLKSLAETLLAPLDEGEAL